MRIAFHLLDRKDNTFKKIYFCKWEDGQPKFCKSKKYAKEYWSDKLANEDIEILKRCESPRAKTLSVRLEE